MPDPMKVMAAACHANALCCETVGAWLQANGLEQPFSRRRQVALWVKAGVFAGSVAAAERIGLKRIHGGCARTGDVILFQQRGGITLGVAYNGLALAAAGGAVAVHRAQFLAAWQVAAR